MSINNNNKDLNDLLKTASSSLGTDTDKIKKEAEKNGLSGLLNNLTPEQAKKVQSLLSDKEATTKLLSTPQAQQLFKKFTKGDKNGWYSR